MAKGAFILDLDLLEEHGLSLDEFVLIIKLKNNDISHLFEDEFYSLQDKHFIKIDSEHNLHLREKAKLLLNLLSVESIKQRDVKSRKPSKLVIDPHFDEFINTYRLLWKGKKPGSMGSEDSCKQKMHRWMKENPQYSKEDIMKAAKIYLDSLENYRFLQRADFFIFKKEDNKEELSRLSAFIEEIDERPVTDWTAKLI